MHGEVVTNQIVYFLDVLGFSVRPQMLLYQLVMFINTLPGGIDAAGCIVCSSCNWRRPRVWSTNQKTEWWVMSQIFVFYFWKNLKKDKRYTYVSSTVYHQRREQHIITKITIAITVMCRSSSHNGTHFSEDQNHLTGGPPYIFLRLMQRIRISEKKFISILLIVHNICPTSYQHDIMCQRLLNSW